MVVRGRWRSVQTPTASVASWSTTNAVSAHQTGRSAFRRSINCPMPLLSEVFLQVAIYCGVPAAVDSFRIAREVFKEQGK